MQMKTVFALQVYLTTVTTVVSLVCGLLYTMGDFAQILSNSRLYCKYEIVTILVFSHVSLSIVLNLSFSLLLVGYITSRSHSKSPGCNLSKYWYLKRQLEYSWQ